MTKKNNIHIQDIDDSYKNEDEFYQKFKDRLADVQSFPSDYSFKFILPSDSEGIMELKEIFGEDSVFDTKASSKGKYTSVTVTKKMTDAAAVVYYYKKCAHIKNIMML